MKQTKNTTFEQRYQSEASLKAEVRLIFRSAINSHWSHDFILKQLKERVYSKQKYLTLPRYTRTQINGYTEALFDNMYELHVEWVHWYSGVFVHKKLPYGEGFNNDLVKSSYVYKGSEDKY